LSGTAGAPLLLLATAVDLAGGGACGDVARAAAAVLRVRSVAASTFCLAIISSGVGACCIRFGLVVIFDMMNNPLVWF
jgi:hypothetical protein